MKKGFVALTLACAPLYSGCGCDSGGEEAPPLSVPAVSTPRIVEFFDTHSSGTGGAIAVDAWGRIVILGWIQESPSVTKLSVWRLLPDGSLDLSFADGGRLVFAESGFAVGQYSASAVAVDASGGIHVAGAKVTFVGA